MFAKLRKSAPGSARPAAAEGLEERRHFTAVIAGFAEQTFANGLTQPTAMEFAPDGRIFVTEQTGSIRIVDTNGQLRSTPFATVSTDSTGERGLLGITLDPSFSSNGYVYVYWTAKTPTLHNRVSRFTVDPNNKNVAKANSRVDLIDLPVLGTATGHNAGALHFGPDGKLYISVGENSQPARAQDVNDPFGKMLRINKDGSIPTSNPFYNTNTGIGKAIWALGLRNPFTFNFQPGTGRMFINDVGQDTWEEIDDGKVGQNYGWPITEGPTNDPRFKGPVYSYKQGDGGAAITGSSFYNPASGASKAFPSQYVGKYFYGDGQGRYVNFINPNNPSSATRFASDVQYVVDIDVAADGSLYILSRGGGYSNRDVPGRVIRYTYTGNSKPSIGQNPENITVAEGDKAEFSVDASGPSLTYQWQRNKVNIPGATSRTYSVNSAKASDNGAKFRVIVSNSAGSVTSTEATLTVSAIAAPEPFINLPAIGAKFTAGLPVNFSGGAGDGNGGQLAASRLTWTVTYFTGGLERPFMPPTSGITSGSFTPDTTTPYLDTDVFYRVRLTATNTSGVSRSIFVDVQPRVANITLASNVPGIQLTLDGVPFTTPYTVGGVVGLHRPLGAAQFQTIGGVTYEFDHWSDGGLRVHDATTPITNVTYNATYKVSTQQAHTLHAVEDAYVRDGASSGINYGSSADLQVKHDGVGWNRSSYLKFDLTSLTGEINSAKLRLSGRLDNTNSPSIAVAMYDAASDWTEATLTWDNKPAPGATPLTGFTVTGTSAKLYEVDLTDFLLARKAAGDATVTVALVASGAISSTTAIFASEESASNKPELLVLAETGDDPEPGPDPDPTTTITLDSTEASYVRDGASAGSNYGGLAELQVKHDGVGWNRYSYLKFDLPTLAGDVESAKLRLFGRLDNTFLPSVAISVFEADSAWDEGTLTWDGKPAPGATAHGAFIVTGTSAKQYEVDLTSYLQQLKAGGATVVTLVLRADVLGQTTAVFNSDEAAADKPELVITQTAAV